MSKKWNVFATPNDVDFSYEVSDVCAVYRGKNSESNASLIVAAPELLEAAIHLLEVGEFCRTDDTESALRQMHAAIAKARGDV